MPCPDRLPELLQLQITGSPIGVADRHACIYLDSLSIRIDSSPVIACPVHGICLVLQEHGLPFRHVHIVLCCLAVLESREHTAMSVVRMVLK